jgi:glycosyltransferase involved in cell wall biosynthesis
LKVLVVSSKYPPEYSGSGLRAHLTYLRLKEKFGIDFEVICSSTESFDPETYQFEGVSVERIVSKPARIINRKLTKIPFRRISNAALTQIEVSKVNRKLKSSQFDLIHTFGFSPATAAAINYSRDHGVPLILELVNPMPTPFQYLPGRKRLKTQDLSKQAAIVAIGKHLGEMCASHGLTDNVWIRPNPVDVGKFSPPIDIERKAARTKISSATENEILVVYVAKYLARKNHSFLLDVLAKLPENFRLVLAGPPLTDHDLVPGLTADQVPSLSRRANDLGVGDRVEISHGFVDMSEYLSAADVFCFPSEKEAMGTPLLESISSGVPVVANADEPSFQEWIVEGKNGYLRSLDAGNWAQAIINAAEFSQDQKNTMSEVIKSSISTDLIDEQYRKLLSKLVETQRNENVDVNLVISS